MQNENIVKALNIIATIFVSLFLFGAVAVGLWLIYDSLIEIGLIVFFAGLIIGILGYIFILTFAGILEELILIREHLEKDE